MKTYIYQHDYTAVANYPQNILLLPEVVEVLIQSNIDTCLFRNSLFFSYCGNSYLLVW